MIQKGGVHYAETNQKKKKNQQCSYLNQIMFEAELYTHPKTNNWF